MKNIVWGVFLIVLGTLLILERFAGVHLPTGTLWPLILFALAASHFASHRMVSGVTFTLIGTVVLACTLGWYGMTYGHSWPLLLVAAGIGIVVRAFMREDSHSYRRPEVPHV